MIARSAEKVEKNMTAAEKVVPIKSPVLSRRVDIVCTVSGSYSNPNGSPRDGGRPRQDPETLMGYITGVCLRSKVRKRWHNMGFSVAIRRQGLLSKAEVIAESALRAGVPLDASVLAEEAEVGSDEDGEEEEAPKPQAKAKGKSKGKGKATKLSPEDAQKVVAGLCSDYLDIRAFGGAITSINESIHGPVQVSFGVSVEPITILDTALTFQMPTTKERAEAGKKTELPQVSVVPFGLYTFHISVSPSGAQRTGFTEADLEVLIDGLRGMYEDDASAVRPSMAVESLIMFQHSCALGDCSRKKLFDSVEVSRRDPRTDQRYALPLSDNELQELGPARSFKDYAVEVNTDGLPDQIEVTYLV